MVRTVFWGYISETPKLGFTGIVNTNLLIYKCKKCLKYCFKKF